MCVCFMGELHVLARTKATKKKEQNAGVSLRWMSAFFASHGAKQANGPNGV